MPQDDEFVEDNRKRPSQPEEHDAPPPTSDDETSPTEQEPVTGETVDAPRDTTSEPLPTGPVAAEEAADAAVEQSDDQSSEPPAEPSQQPDAATASQPAADPRSPNQHIDWSEWEIVEGRFDPVTGKMLSSGHELV